MIYVLQKILFPRKEICDRDKLYFRSNSLISNDGDTFSLDEGASISFDTYFNLFSLEKWSRYTNVTDFGLRLSVRGSVQIDILQLAVDAGDKEVKRTVVSSSKVETGDGIGIWFCLGSRTGVLTFRIKALTGSTISRLEYVGKSESHRIPPSLAIGICTYKREKYIIRNVNAIYNDVISNEDSQLYGKCDVYIADNGQTIDDKMFDGEHIFVFKNLNYGGTGGFTRTMIEAIFNSGKCYDYMVLMDDDITLDTRVFERLQNLLRLLKPEYQSSIVGGAMLCEERQNIQFESGARFTKEKGIILSKEQYDLEQICNAIRNEKTNHANYNAWCFCTIPAKIITETNLPLPMFIHYDDAEYGIRNANELILLNGICVWHPYAKGKAPLWMTYYDIRNQWISYAKHGFRRKLSREFKFMQDSFYSSISKYRYSNFTLIVKGLIDFYKGCDKFKKTDPLIFHTNLTSKYQYKWEKLDLLNVNVAEVDMKYSKFHSKIKLFLPAFKRPVYASKKVDKVDNIYRKRVWIVDKENSCGYCLEKKYSSIFKSFILMVKAMWFISMNYKRAWESWEQGCVEMTTLNFWKNYLHLEEQN